MLRIAPDGGRELLVEGRRQGGVLVDGLHQGRRAAGEHRIRDLDLAYARPAGSFTMRRAGRKQRMHAEGMRMASAGHPHLSRYLAAHACSRRRA